MSTLPAGGQRFVDGPRRHPNIKSGPRLDGVASPASTVVEPDVPEVFEYQRPSRWRGRLWRFTKWGGLAVLVLAVAAGGFLGVKTFMATRKIITKSDGSAPALSGALKPDQLKGEGSGRVNILVLGIGGQGHDGPNLSDTMMVWSIDPQTKDVAMLSIPRDLYVQIPGHGYGKINSANALGGPQLSEKVVETVIGEPINYYALVDFSGFKQAVDAVGGVDVNVQTALIDPKFPCDDGTRYAGKYCPIHFYPGLQHMNGETALEYSRSRETTSDFARAARQQTVLVALRQKAMQLSTLTNPLKIAGLIDAVGDHFRTDLQLNDMERLAQIAKDVDTSRINQSVIDTSGPTPLLEVGENLVPGAGSIELPTAGEFNYSAIQDYVKNIFVDHYIVEENARIEVENGSGVTGVAGTLVKSLESAHYNVSAAVNAPAPQAQTVLYDYTNGGKPYTINYLEQRLGVKVIKIAPPSPKVDASGQTVQAPQIRIILGSDYQPPTDSD